MSAGTDALRSELKLVADRLVLAFKGTKPEFVARGKALGERAIAIGEDVIAKKVTGDEAADYLDKFKLAIVSEANVAGYKTQAILADAITAGASGLLRVASIFLHVDLAPLLQPTPKQPFPTSVGTPTPLVPPEEPKPLVPTPEHLREQIERLNDMRRPELPSKPIPSDVRTGVGFTEVWSAAENLMTALTQPHPSNPILAAVHRYELALNTFNDRTRTWIVFGS